MMKGVRKPSEVSPYKKDINPFPGGSKLMTYFPKTPTPYTITVGTGISTYELGRDTFNS